MFSVPFNPKAYQTLVRASVNSKGKTIFHEKPEYHGNPVSKKGSLSYYTFGWELLDTLKKIGFKEVNAIVYWSKKYAYLGGEQFLFSAKK
ncbi:hypothetical protein [Marinicella rhabdoformis]|uniref:hypothetical protein n=1 Tax=Marinicella rhabdoformis TaxID=2580566 RepID=UPI0012AED7A9|nr:hypothetical protein [Marinicella rhabdoformis]